MLWSRIRVTKLFVLSYLQWRDATSGQKKPSVEFYNITVQSQPFKLCYAHVEDFPSSLICPFLFFHSHRLFHPSIFFHGASPFRSRNCVAESLQLRDSSSLLSIHLHECHLHLPILPNRCTTPSTSLHLRFFNLEESIREVHPVFIFIFFYLNVLVQRSGKLPGNQRLKWRRDSGLSDGSDAHVDLVGGYYDAGDNVKFGFPMAFTTTVLFWSVLEFGGTMKAELQNARVAIKWATDYLLKATAHSGIIYVQVGDAKKDHACWERPEDMDTPRTVIGTCLFTKS